MIVTIKDKLFYTTKLMLSAGLITKKNSVLQTYKVSLYIKVFTTTVEKKYKIQTLNRLEQDNLDENLDIFINLIQGLKCKHQLESGFLQTFLK